MVHHCHNITASDTIGLLGLPLPLHLLASPSLVVSASQYEIIVVYTLLPVGFLTARSLFSVHTFPCISLKDLFFSCIALHSISRLGFGRFSFRSCPCLSLIHLPCVLQTGHLEGPVIHLHCLADHFISKGDMMLYTDKQLSFTLKWFSECGSYFSPASFFPHLAQPLPQNWPLVCITHHSKNRCSQKISS